jgi:Domain of unknown function (DUF4262)
MASVEEKTRENIAKFGCSIIHVMEEGELPPFAYSVGITQQTGAPEVVVIGLKRNVAHSVVNEYNNRVREGERLTPGQLYSGFIEGFDVQAEEVPLTAYDEYFGQNLKLYGGPNFRVLQLVYPTTTGIWPWSEQAPESFLSRQPVLSRAGKA